MGWGSIEKKPSVADVPWPCRIRKKRLYYKQCLFKVLMAEITINNVKNIVVNI